jgi:hypothetical protein
MTNKNERELFEAFDIDPGEDRPMEQYPLEWTDERGFQTANRLEYDDPAVIERQIAQDAQRGLKSIPREHNGAVYLVTFLADEESEGE